MRMTDSKFHQHLADEMDRMVKEMQHAHMSWSDIVETLQELVQAELWHIQGFVSWWIG